MGLISLIVALLIEQARPLSPNNFIFSVLTKYVNLFEYYFNIGEKKYGIVAWLLVMTPVVLVVVVIYYWLLDVNFLLAWAWNVLMLYFTMGFRQFSHYFTDIQVALKSGDLDLARELLATWRGEPCDSLTADEVARLTIEQALLSAHHHVFGVIVWFVLVPGPIGAVFYRMAYFLKRKWSNQGMETELGKFADQAFFIINWIPLRITAAAFAIVGNFEDAIYCWRNQSRTWPDPEQGVILASGAGAMGIRLGLPIKQTGTLLMRPELGLGEEATSEAMQSAVGLVWRAVVLWVLVLLLCSVANLVGRVF